VIRDSFVNRNECGSEPYGNHQDIGRLFLTAKEIQCLVVPPFLGVSLALERRVLPLLLLPHPLRPDSAHFDDRLSQGTIAMKRAKSGR
jgi:hypothetical protein